MVSFFSRQIFELLVLYFCIGAGVAHATKPVPIFVLEQVGHHGKPIPTDKNLKRLFAYVERESGLRFEAQSLPWNRAKMMALNGSGLVYGMSKSPERLAIFHFSLPIKTEQVWAITYGDTKPVITNISDLNGRNVTITRGFTFGIEFEQAKNIVFSVEENYDFYPEQLKRLVKKPDNVVLWPAREFPDAKQFQVYFHQIALPSYNDPDFAKLKFNVSSQPLFLDTSHFASVIGKYDAEINKIDEVIRRGTKNGEIAKILNKKN